MLVQIPYLMRLDIPAGGVHTVKDWYHQCRVIRLQTSVKTDDLKYRSDGKEDKSYDGSYVSELVTGVLMGKRARYHLDTDRRHLDGG